MKQRLIFIIIFLLTFQLNVNAQTYKVTIDTLYLNMMDIARPATRVNLTHAVKYDDKYYCFFEENWLYSFMDKTRYFLIVSNNGTILKNIELPKDLKNTVYFDFFIRNDSLLAKTYMDHGSYYFDINKSDWTQIAEVDDGVYEDSNFKVTYLNFGEWGQTTWFIDKQTQKEYVLGTCGTTVSLHNGKYYLTNGSKISEIENPLNLTQCDSDYYYQLVEKETKFYEGSSSLIGLKVIYKDTMQSHFSFDLPKQIILTSFVSDNQLFQLYSDSTSTYVGKIENERLIPVQNVGKKYSTFNWNYSYRGKNLKNDSRFLKFSEVNNTFGFIEIHKNNIAIHYLKHNVDSLNYLGSDGFGKLLKLLKGDPSTVLLDQVANLEKKLGGTDMRTDKVGISHNGYYPESYSSMNVKTKDYMKVEDKFIALNTEYLYSDLDQKVKSLFLEWLPTEQYNQTNSFMFLDDKPEILTRFKNKQNEIVEIISDQLGFEPKRKDGGNDDIELSWNTKNDLEIVLYGSNTFKGKKEIRMIINLK